MDDVMGDITVTHSGDVLITVRLGEVFSANVDSGGRKIKRWFHSEVPASEQMQGIGYRSARQAAAALVKEKDDGQEN